MSLIIKPAFDVSKAGLVTSAAAVAVAEAIQQVCGKKAGIKWVNDVYVEGKKVCGILTEGITDLETGQIESIIIGIGINTTLKDFPPELLEIVGAVEGNYSKPALAATVISKTLDLINTMNSTPAKGTHFMDKYRELSLLPGKTVTVYKGAYKIHPEDEIPSRPAKVLDIDDAGGLVVLYSDGSRETLTSGEVSIRPE